MQRFNIWKTILIAGLWSTLSACGGGGGTDGNDSALQSVSSRAPSGETLSEEIVFKSGVVASGQAFTFQLNIPSGAVENSSAQIDQIKSVEFLKLPQNGLLSSVDELRSYSYTSINNFIGKDEFSVQATTDLGRKLVYQVGVTNVSKNAEHTVTSLDFSLEGAVLTDLQTQRKFFTSESIKFTIPPDTLSFELVLMGEYIGTAPVNASFHQLVKPNGDIISNDRLESCNGQGLCTILMPQTDDGDLQVMDGEWQLVLGGWDNVEGVSKGTVAATTNLHLVLRQGAEINEGVTPTAKLYIKPFLASSQLITPQDTQAVIDRMVLLFKNMGIVAEFDALEVITDVKYSVVSSRFDSPGTAELVSLGAADRVNIFFVEGFSDEKQGILGVSAGVPGSLGIQGRFNGVVLNALELFPDLSDSSSLAAVSNELRIRESAVASIHEIGHFLGLFHTSEKNGKKFDPLSDTSECHLDARDGVNPQGVQDRFIDGVECIGFDSRNLMFYELQPNNLTPEISEWQRRIIIHSPLAIRPDVINE